MNYPEHARLSAIKDKSQLIGYFLDWLDESKDYKLCAVHRHSTECYGEDGKAWGTMCEKHDGEFYPVYPNIEKVLAEHFGIDLKKLEAEKLQMLKECREFNTKKATA